MSEETTHGHHELRVATAGVPLATATAAMVMVHGRGATAESILELASEFSGEDLAFLAPKARGQTWYPNTFLAPIPSNEPWLSSALGVLGELCGMLETDGPGLERTILLGFSQGACLTLEFAARNARRYGGIAGLTGGLIGPQGTPRDYEGSFSETPVFLGCSDTDPHIPRWRVEETSEVLSRMGARVTTRIYPGMGHTINRDEVDAVRQMVQGITSLG
jgi:phospholipase/carboxylesterase